MKTTIDIRNGSLAEAMKFSHAKTKREAVQAALDEFNQRHRMAQAVKYLGTFEDFMTQDELMASRQEGGDTTWSVAPKKGTAK